METLLTAEAEEKGFGRGQTAAGMSNFRSIPNIIAPLLYAVRPPKFPLARHPALLPQLTGGGGGAQAAYNRGVLAGFPKALFLARCVRPPPTAARPPLNAVAKRAPCGCTG